MKIFAKDRTTYIVNEDISWRKLSFSKYRQIKEAGSSNLNSGHIIMEEFSLEKLS